MIKKKEKKAGDEMKDHTDMTQTINLGESKEWCSEGELQL